MREKSQRSVYTTSLTPEQGDRLRLLLDKKGYQFYEAPHTVYAAKGPDVSISFYKSGKLVVQGRGTEDFVQFILEPEVLQEVRFGYEEIHHPEWFEPHIGIDESGKGDVFGPLCIAAVYTDRAVTQQLIASGIVESKKIKSFGRLKELVDLIRRLDGLVAETVVIGNEAYNRLLEQLKNVNRLLAWGHARALENLLERLQSMGKEVKYAISDQFASSTQTLRQALLAKGRHIRLAQRHKAETDPAVAAASLLARWEFLQRLHAMSNQWQIRFPKGAGPEADKALVQFIQRHGTAALPHVAKMHFSNVQRLVAGNHQAGS